MPACASRELRPRRSERGFTLIEMLVVLTIIALAMTAVPMVFAGLPSIRLRAAADGMAATLRQLHDQAIRRGETTELILDPATRTYRVSTDAVLRRLPAVVAKVGFTTAAFWRSDNSASIRFFADGSATGGTIVFEHGRRAAAVTVDWLTGRVQRNE